MIRSAYELFRERGFSGTGLREINARSGVPHGAVYHHFPAGKTELAAEVIALAGTEVGDALEAFAATADDPAAAVGGFVAGWKQHVRAHEFVAGCAIVAIVSESKHQDPALTSAAAKAFARWQEILASSLRRAGVIDRQAKALATLAIAAVEGAVVIARAERTTRALDEIGLELPKLFADAVATAG